MSEEEGSEDELVHEQTEGDEKREEGQGDKESMFCYRDLSCSIDYDTRHITNVGWFHLKNILRRGSSNGTIL